MSDADLNELHRLCEKQAEGKSSPIDNKRLDYLLRVYDEAHNEHPQNLACFLGEQWDNVTGMPPSDAAW